MFVMKNKHLLKRNYLVPAELAKQLIHRIPERPALLEIFCVFLKHRLL